MAKIVMQSSASLAFFCCKFFCSNKCYWFWNMQTSTVTINCFEKKRLRRC